MIEVLIFLASGLFLLALLLLWTQRHRLIAKRMECDPKVKPGPAILNLAFPSPQIAGRIFAEEDWEFVLSKAPAIRKLFLQERKSVALLWVRQVQSGVAQVMDFHRTAVRKNVDLRPEAEIWLAVDYLAFSLLCGVLRGLIWWQGPFAARRVVAQVVGEAERISFATGQVLASLDPAVINKMKEGWLNSSLKV